MTDIQTQIRPEDFNEQQKNAVARAVEWFKGWQSGAHKKQIFRLGGFAGTGKTTVAQHIANLCGGENRVVFIAPTGKAASRLRQKGCKFAKTFHSFVYNVRGEDAEGDPIFIAKGALDEKPLLVMCDEASMVGGYDRRNLLKHGLPVLELGDPGQVPPVKDSQEFTMNTLDVLLEQIERNAGNIVKASMFVRQGKRLPLREYDDVRVRDGKPDGDTIKEHLGEDGVIICSYNSTRVAMNLKARELLGFSGELPQVGEKVICTFNQHGHGFMNGEQGIVVNYADIPPEEREDDDDEDLMYLRIKSLTDGRERQILFNPVSFSPDEEQRKSAQKGIGGMDFGYVLTVHKSQGSEWPRVMIMEERLRGVPHEQMLYTAITRAIDQFTLYRQ
jgi:exodeoxyribonuclease V